MKNGEQDRTGTGSAPAAEPINQQADRRVVEVHCIDYRRMRPLDLNFQVVWLAGGRAPRS